MPLMADDLDCVVVIFFLPLELDLNVNASW
jgi:hypothetical protein